jgi:ABC-type sugar transport system permease subunit
VARDEDQDIRANAQQEADELIKDARLEAERAEREAAKVRSAAADPAQQEEWIRQNNLIHAGLIGIGTIMVQPFLTADSLNVAATISVVAFSVAIPLLAALVLVNKQEFFRRRATKSVIVAIARPVALSAAFVGVVAGFWHMSWLAGAGMLAGGLVATGVHSAGYWRLERDGEPTVPGTDGTGATSAGAGADGA